MSIKGFLKFFFNPFGRKVLKSSSCIHINIFYFNFVGFPYQIGNDISKVSCVCVCACEPCAHACMRKRERGREREKDRNLLAGNHMNRTNVDRHIFAPWWHLLLHMTLTKHFNSIRFFLGEKILDICSSNLMIIWIGC